jgi:hypothetical protein
MPIRIEAHADQHNDAVAEFNARLIAGGERTQFPCLPTPKWLPKLAGRKLFQEHFLAVDETAAVRGAYILKHQEFWIKNRVVRIADYHGPVSEGAVDRNYPQVGVQLLRDALGRQPLLFGLGMGGYDEPLAKLLKAAGWNLFAVPFLFRIVRPSAFLRNISYLRRRPARRKLLDLLAITGIGWLGIRALQSARYRSTAKSPAVAAELVADFSDWADELWQQERRHYGMSAVRDAESLRILYPKHDARFLRLKVTERTQPIGWAVLLDTTLSNHKQFGNMRLGSIVDCFAAPGNASKVMRQARDCLESRGVDLIISNQSHAAWCRGLAAAGFQPGPSNYLFASSRKLTELLNQEGVADESLHLTRGDGDGPINL